jgi:aspartyl protease family protein
MADPSRVGITKIEGTVTGPGGVRATVHLLVDSGAKYTLLPHEVWTRLGLTPKRRMRFQLADGATIERAIAECHVALAEGDGHTPVILGEPGDVALLGVVTLEELGLVFYPFDRSLRRSELSLLA